MTGPAMLESRRVRQDIRSGRITGTSRGLAHGFVQCNLAILPKEYAFCASRRDHHDSWSGPGRDRRRDVYDADS